MNRVALIMSALLFCACDLWPDGPCVGDGCDGDTDGGAESSAAWCFTHPETLGPMRNWCYPIEHGDPGVGYQEADCAAVFDFDAWNYDGTCQPGACDERVTTARLCFDDEHAGQVAGKAPGDLSVRTCWEDPIGNGDVFPTLYLSGEYADDELHSPLCIPTEDVSNPGPMCVHNLGVVCLSHNLFCSCRCVDDSDCGEPTVCQGYTPGSLAPSYCVAPFG